MNNLETIKQSFGNMSKASIEITALDVQSQIENGEINPLELLRTFKTLEKLIENVKPILDKAALAEAEKYPEKTVELLGAKFTKKEGTPTYDWSVCNDEVLNELQANQKEYVEVIKKRQEFLKNISGSIQLVTKEGEVVDIYPPVKSSKSIVQVTIE